MNSSLFNLDWKDLGGAIISAIIVALVGYLSKVTNISQIDYNQLLNIALLTGITSLLKALGTNEYGRFLGAVKVK